MPVEYSMAEPAIHQAVWALVGQHHPSLANLDKGEIAVVFREKASKSGGQVVLGLSRKAQPLVNALAGERYKFILELPKDVWIDLKQSQREALLDHLLCSCVVEEDPNNGTFKFSVAKPDVMAFRANIKRYGMWFPEEEGDDGDDGSDPVSQMFGDDGE